MFDSEQCVGCVRIANSFYDKTTAGLVDCLDEDRDVKVAAEYTPQWKEAQANLDRIEAGEEAEFTNHVEVASHTTSGYRMSMRYGFMTLKEFSDKYGLDVKHIPSLKVLDRWCSSGSRVLKGVAFTPLPGDEYKFRILEHFWETHTMKDRKLMRHCDRLRERQPDDIFLGTTKAEASKVPAALVEGNHGTIVTSI